MPKIKIDKNTVVFGLLAFAVLIEIALGFPLFVKKLINQGSRISHLKQQVSSVKTEWARKDSYTKEETDIKSERSMIQKGIVSLKQSSKILSFISTSSKDFNIEISSFSPSDPQPGYMIGEVEFCYLPITLNAKGEFSDLIRFLKHLEASEYFFRVGSLDIVSSRPSHLISILLWVVVEKKQ